MRTLIIKNSRIPFLLSCLSPITWMNKLLGKEPFEIIAISLGPLIICEGEPEEHIINHETIHCLQWQEMFFIGFLLIYIYDFIIGLFKYGDAESAYFMIRAEQEAFNNEFDNSYLINRKPYSWLKDYKV